MPRKAAYAFAPFDDALAAAKAGAQVLLCDVSNFLPEVADFLAGPDRPPALHSLTHSVRVGAEPKYRGDVSTACVFAFLEDPRGEDHLGIAPGSFVLVSNDHFDHDGLLGILGLLDAVWARQRKELLVDAALAGDFNKVRNRDAARIVWTIDAFTRPSDPSRTPLPANIFQFDDMAKLFGDLYREMIPRAREIVEDVGRFEEHWREQDALFDETMSHLHSDPPLIRISRHPDVSLAVVRVDDTLEKHSRFAVYTELAYGGNGRDCYAVAVVHRGIWNLTYRYEAYVDYVSEPTPMPVTMDELAARLNKEEAARGGAVAGWTAGDISRQEGGPHLGNKAPTALPSAEVEAAIVEHLRKSGGKL
ncbi:hypothetical protein DFJ74DRAFT_735475 [Hyaloraphidium curvatum]|nr:hypothetical protein DFJ74DRAFT_735475 [Hyaloraphidium curvatum]